MSAPCKTHGVGMSGLFGRFRKNARGVALIEFAMVVPVLIILYLGGFQLMEAVSVYRKVTTTARSLADLTTQYTNVTNTDLQSVLDASTQIMAPYSPTKGSYRISLINVDNAGVATVAWSRSQSGQGQLVVGSSYALPNNIKENNLDMIVCDVAYTYQPIAFFSLIGAIPFNDQIIMIPRGSDTIILDT